MIEKMRFKDMISMLDGAAGRLIISAMDDSAVKEAMKMVNKVSMSLGEWEQEMEEEDDECQ